MDYNNEISRFYVDRIRIYLILVLFSKDNLEENKREYAKIFESEVRIQKIDFLLRNPDYFAYELIQKASANEFSKEEIKEDIKHIYHNGEPIIMRLEMERFFFGAYEDIDDVIAFLHSYGFISFSSKKSIDMKTINKKYYISSKSLEKINDIDNFPTVKWYANRCELIKKYFGDVNGTLLKDNQYKIDEYKNTSYKTFISSIDGKVREEFLEIFGEEL